MRNYFKQYERIFFLLLLAATVASGIVGIVFLIKTQPIAARWFATSGLLATVAGFVQLDISGLFDKISEKYGDENKYSHGPPSFITREIIDIPDRILFSWFRGTAFFNSSTGYWLIVVGTLIQVVAVWLI